MLGWAELTLASAVFLALYDLCKKASVRENAVLPVLLCSTSFGAAAFVVVLAATGGFADAFAAGWKTIALAMVKAVVVSISWIFTFTALRSLPITIATPIRASAPALVVVLAFFLYEEIPSLWQGIGMILVFAGYWAFSWAGRAEGIDFLRNRAVWCAVAGAVFSAASSLLDKYVFQNAGVGTNGVQLYFQAWLVVVYAAFLVAGRLQLAVRRDAPRHRFVWRWTIPFVGILLAGADWLYFHALSVPGSHISVVALLRRFSVVITFVIGAFVFRETNLRRKLMALAAVLAGVILICFDK